MRTRKAAPARASRVSQGLRYLAPCLIVVTMFAFIGASGYADAVSSREQVRLPDVLRRLVRPHPAPVDAALRALKAGVDHFTAGRFAEALAALPDERAAATTSLGDYAILFRARAALALQKPAEAVDGFRRMRAKFPGSPLERQSIAGEADAQIAQRNSDAALQLLDSPKLAENSETLFLKARAHEAAGRRTDAARLYLRVHASFPRSEFAPSAAQRLKLLAPGFQTDPANYRAMLERAENLLRANTAREARTVLTALVRVRPPDSAASQKRYLLLAQAETATGRAAVALPLLEKITGKSPALHPQALSVKATCLRRLQREQDFLATRDALVRLYPTSPFTEQALYNVATYFDVENRAEEAERAYVLLWEKFPDGEHARRSLWKAALYAYVAGRLEEARGRFLTYLGHLASAQDPSAALYWIARCSEKLGETGVAGWLYGAIQKIGGDSYVAQRARESAAALPTTAQAAVPPSMPDVRRLLDSWSAQPISFPEPSGQAAVALDRIVQLASAGMLDLAAAEARAATTRFPGETGLIYAAARIEEMKGNPGGAIVVMRRAVSDYDTRPLESLPEEVWDTLFPSRFRAEVEREATRRGLDPNLILGLIRQESAFREDAVSPANARGLMQVLPSTARKLAPQAGVGRYSLAKLHSASSNVAIGCLHFSTLLARFGKPELALAAYNAGEHRVEAWLQQFGGVDLTEFVERIPFSETRAYVKQILTNAAVYRRLSESR